MWSRKELKKKAKVTLKNNYWTAIVVCFLITILTGEFGTSVTGIWQFDNSVDPDYAIRNESVINEEQVDNRKIQEVQQQTEEMENRKSQLTDLQLKIWDAVNANINGMTKTQKFIFKIWDAAELITIKQPVLAVGLIITSIIAIVYIILMAEPLKVAERRYFIKARDGTDVKMGEMKETFKRGRWSNVALIMLAKNVYNTLWWLTIIGGIIKQYEYRMIPYILAENPTIERKEAFRRSKEMMQGNKWRAFVLDMSFIPWTLLSYITFGLLNIFYVNPYRISTSVELYETLKEKNKEKATLSYKAFKLRKNNVN